MTFSIPSARHWVSTSLCGVLLAFGSGCDVTTSSPIQQAVVSISSDLQVVTVGLQFNSTFQETYSGSYAIGNYGTVFADAYSATTPFEVGFTLNTDIVNDQNYVNLTATEQLPNGDPIGINYPLVQIQAKTPISNGFDIYAYVDVSQATWLGGAAILNVLNDANLPSGMAVTEVLKSNSAGIAEVFGSVFSPVLNSDGSLDKAGGIAIFANIKELIVDGLSADHSMILKPERAIKLR